MPPSGGSSWTCYAVKYRSNAFATNVMSKLSLLSLPMSKDTRVFVGLHIQRAGGVWRIQMAEAEERDAGKTFGRDTVNPRGTAPFANT